MTVKYVYCYEHGCRNLVPETVVSGTCAACASREAKDMEGLEDWLTLPDPQFAEPPAYNWADAPRDELYLVLEAGYHCGHTDAEVRAMFDQHGLEQPSDETLAHWRGTYADFEASFADVLRDDMDSALFCAEEMAKDIAANTPVTERTAFSAEPVKIPLISVGIVAVGDGYVVEPPEPAPMKCDHQHVIIFSATHDQCTECRTLLKVDFPF